MANVLAIISVILAVLTIMAFANITFVLALGISKTLLLIATIITAFLAYKK